MDFTVAPSEEVNEGRELVKMYDLELENKLNTLFRDVESAGNEATSAEDQAKQPDLSQADKINLRMKAVMQRNQQASKQKEFQSLITRANADRSRFGYFALRAPLFTPEESMLVNHRTWTVLNANFREEWKGKQAKPSDPLLRLGAKEGPWEIELKIPQKHMGQILLAFERFKTPQGEYQPLEVDFLVRNDATHTYKGMLERSRISGEANPTRDDNNESEPVVMAYVRIDGTDIPEGYRMPRVTMLAGSEVRVKVRCGKNRLGYALFYGIWEFMYEKVLFFF
jgi:hypothetical protein